MGMKRGSQMMNYVAISGKLLGDSDLRVLESTGRELLNFELWVDGDKGSDPVVHIAYFPKDGDVRKIRDQTRVVVYGTIRYRCDHGGLFVAARELVIVMEESGEQSASASRKMVVRK